MIAVGGGAVKVVRSALGDEKKAEIGGVVTGRAIAGFW